MQISVTSSIWFGIKKKLYKLKIIFNVQLTK